MSMFPKANGALAGTLAPHEERAAHAGAAFDETVKAFRQTIDTTDELVYLAHYSSGVFDLSIDLLGDPLQSADAVPGTARRNELQRLGRALSFSVSGLDRSLQKVRTGGLIRMVLHTERGVGFCDAVVPEQYLVGLVLGWDVPPASPGPLSQMMHIRSTDVAIARLATRLRQRISLASENPGGWESAGGGAGSVLEWSRDSVVTGLTDPDERVHRLKDACQDALRPAGLHFVAYCRCDMVAFTIDQFADGSLAPFFAQISVAARRRFYRDFSSELYNLANRFSRTTSDVLGGLLLRLVLDVEQGAIYYYRLGAGDHLVGVTIDQSVVSQADDRMSQLAHEARAILAG